MVYKRKATSLEMFFTRSPFSVVTMVARIKGNISEHLVKTAVHKAQQRHILLLVRIREDENHQQWFTSEGVEEIPVEVIRRKTEADWIEIHAQASRVPFEFERRPAIRFILVRAPEASDLIILCHHMICDGMSLAYLARDMMTYLGDPAGDVPILEEPVPIDLGNLPVDIRPSSLRKAIIQRMNVKWVEERETFDQIDYEIISKAYWEHFHHKTLPVEFSEAETSAFVARCREEGVTVNSALATAFGGAQRRVEGERPYHSRYMVASNVRDRIKNPPGEGVGYYAGGIAFNYKFNPKKSFWQNARNFHKKIQSKYVNKLLFAEMLDWLHLEPTIFEAMNFKKLGRLVPPHSSRYGKLSTFSKNDDVVSDVLKRGKIESLEHKEWGTAITNLGRLDFPKNYGDLELERLILQPGGGLPLAHVNLVLGAVTCSGKLSLIIEYAEEAVTSKIVHQIKDEALELMLR